ncbi:hypothetical protein, partial [Leptospira interrogans]|uniref:hypothetical protein n=1 Tax=Leptospira interrogans TaxID=173 RepID=UPI0006ACA927
IVFGFNLERDLSSAHRNETLSLKKVSAKFQTQFCLSKSRHSGSNALSFTKMWELLQKLDEIKTT